MSEESPKKAVPEIKNKEQANVYLLLIWFLGLVGLISIIGAIVLAGVGRAVPESVVALGATSIGALAGLLAPSPKS